MIFLLVEVAIFNNNDLGDSLYSLPVLERKKKLYVLFVCLKTLVNFMVIEYFAKFVSLTPVLLPHIPSFCLFSFPQIPYTLQRNVFFFLSYSS